MVKPMSAPPSLIFSIVTADTESMPLITNSLKSVLLSLVLPDTNMNERDEEISEMHQLAYTLNYEITDVIYQRKIKIDSSTYFGKGKIKRPPLLKYFVSLCTNSFLKCHGKTK